MYAAPTGTKPEGLSPNTMRLYGTGRTKYAGIYQDIPQTGAKGDVYRAGGWSLNYSKPRKGENYRYNIRMAFLKTGTASERLDSESIEWSEEWTEWQFAAGPVIAPCAYKSIRFNVDYQRNINYAEFGGLFLNKEEFGQTYAYDGKGNVTQVTNPASMQSRAAYDTFDNLTSYVQPGRPSGVKTTFDYGSTDPEMKRHLLKKSTSPLGIVQAYTYDAKGNPETAMTRNSGNTLFVKGETAYTTDKNYVKTQKDARGKVVTITTDTNKGTVTGVTDPAGQTASYTYDALRRVTKANTTAGGKVYKNEYAYTDDQLSSVKHNTAGDASGDVSYTFGYDASKRPMSVKVGNQVLSENQYNNTPGDPLRGTLKGITYGNGGSVRNTYDAFKRVTGIRYDNDTTDRYAYDFGANGQTARVTDNALNRSARSEYDTADRPMRVTHTENGAHLYTGEAEYDAYNNLKAFKEKVGAARTAYQTGLT